MEKITQNSPGDFTQNARSEMFVSLQTYHIAVRSTAKAIKILLQNGCIFILIYFYLLQLESREMYFTFRNTQGKYNKRNSWNKSF